MPYAHVRYYCDDKKAAPVDDWLEALKTKDKLGYAACVAKIRVLAAMGLDARRPTVEYLRDGIFELRAKKGRVQYRILFFYHGSDVVILAHAIIKKGNKVPDKDIDLAKKRKMIFEEDTEAHTYEKEID